MLCKGAPEEFNKYIQNCRNTKFEEKPDYNFLRSLFKQIMQRCGFEFDGQFDWILKKEGKLNVQQSLMNEKPPVPLR